MARSKHSSPIGSELLWLLFGLVLVCALIVALLCWLLSRVGGLF